MGLAKKRMGMAKWGIAVIKETVEDKKGIVGIRRGWVKLKSGCMLKGKGFLFLCQEGCRLRYR
jgi:hypothetical protein